MYRSIRTSEALTSNLKFIDAKTQNPGIRQQHMLTVNNQAQAILSSLGLVFSTDARSKQSITLDS